MIKKISLALLSFIVLIVLAVLFLYPQKEEPFTLGIEKEVTAQQLHVEGRIPNWLQGIFIRNSAIPIFQNGKQVSHFFDGLAMLHGFDFQNGNVFYSNRYIRSGDWDQAANKKNPNFGGFASTPQPTFWQRLQNIFSPSPDIQNASVNVFRYGDQAVALTETPLPVSFDLKSLQTLGSFEFQDNLPKERCWESAHPHRDAATKEIFNYLIDFGPQSHYVFYRIPHGSSSRIPVAKIPVSLPSYMHSFAMTDHFLILTEFPLVIDPRALMRGESILRSMSWQPESKCTFTVIDKQSGSVVSRTQTEPFFSFHHANAYENEDGLIIDLVAYPDIFGMKEIFPDASPSDHNAPSWKNRLMRYILSLATNKLISEVILENELEFPRLDDRLDGKPYRYLYLTISENNTGGLVKVDFQTKETKIFMGQEGSTAVEPVFVPAPQAQHEDEGIVLTVVQNKEEAYLLALDAQTFKEIVRAKLPFPISNSFHGQFFSESAFIHPILD